MSASKDCKIIDMHRTIDERDAEIAHLKNELMRLVNCASEQGGTIIRLLSECDRLRSELDAALDVVIDLGGEVRTTEIEEARQMREDAKRWRAYRTAGGGVTLRLHYMRSDMRDAAIDAARKG